MVDSKRVGTPYLLGFLSSATVGGILGAVIGFFSAFPSGFAIAFTVPGVVLGGLAGVIAFTAGLVYEKLDTRNEGTRKNVRVMTALVSACAATAFIVLGLGVANNSDILSMALLTFVIAALIAYLARPVLLKEAGK